MKITAIELDNVRGFKKLEKTEFSDSINIFIGPNNAGKSTILNSILCIERSNLYVTDVTLGQDKGVIQLFIDGSHSPEITKDYKIFTERIVIGRGNLRYLINNQGTEREWGNRIQKEEPHNLIYPYLSKRKVAGYSQEINEHTANSVSGTLSNIFAKIDRLNTPQHPSHKKYIEACNNIL
ncbi:MAG: AAA family ATPase [Bacteroidetes bacterium]|nr:AAA family ATPase [Bacteroidota bacterium]